MRKLLSLLLGLHECASPTEMRKQYQNLTAALFNAENECSQDHSWRYESARDRLKVAFEKSRDQLAQATPLRGSVTGSGVLLGEILVDAEVITSQQLQETLDLQAQSKPPLPLGRVLVAQNYLSWEQLAYYMRLQDLLQLPATHHLRLSRQLTELGLASAAEMEVAELDCETTGCAMFHAVTRRGWVKPALLAALTCSPTRSLSKEIEEKNSAATAGSTNMVAV